MYKKMGFWCGKDEGQEVQRIQPGAALRMKEGNWALR